MTSSNDTHIYPENKGAEIEAGLIDNAGEPTDPPFPALLVWEDDGGVTDSSTSR